MTIFNNLIQRIKNKHLSPFERLSHSERQLNEFLKLKKEQKIEGFTTLLKPAISRINSVLATDVNDYSKNDTLNADFLFTDIDILPYYDEHGNIFYEMLTNASRLEYPKGDYTLENAQFGLYELDGKTEYSIRIAIDYYLDIICMRWLNEIKEIKKAVT